MYSDKVNELVSILRNFTIEDARKVEENVDQQFIALKQLYSQIKNKNLFVPLVTANALVSYQLNTTGENYWWEFSNYFSQREIDNPLSAMKEFLLGSKGNKRYLQTKIKRLEKFFKYLPEFQSRENYFYENMNKLNEFLAKIMGQKKEAKTIVFAVKMFGYAMRIKTKKFVPYPFDVAIPLDSRIERITKKLTDKNPVEFWFWVSREVKIPPLHLDGLIWPLLGKEDNLEKLRTLLPEKYKIFAKIETVIALA